MKHLLIILSILLLSSPVIGQSSKPLGVVFPPTAMGNVSESRQRILLNTLDDEISQYFDVSPPPKIERGELPVVEDSFQLQIVEEDGDTQLTLRWMSGNERKVETILCGGCKTIELNGKLEELVENLLREKGILYEGKRNGIFGYYTKKWEGVESKYNEDRGKYEGEIVNGVPHGHGTFTYYNFPFPNGTKFVAEWKNGKLNGPGESTDYLGDLYIGKYVGEYKDGNWHGQGTYTWSDGRKYVGEYKDGKYHGHGTFTSPDGEKYEGEWKDGKTNGEGTISFPDGRKYVGEFKDGKYHGQGTLTWKNGKRTQATYTWSNGNKYDRSYDRRFGRKGKVYYKNGQIYEGGIYDDFYYNKGVKTLSDGSKYEGVWRKERYDKIFKWKIKGYDKYGKIILEINEGNGKGLYVTFDGQKYEGEWKDGEIDGQGTWTSSDGKKYEGEFKDGKFDGQGTLTYPDGRKYEGEWKDGTTWNGTLFVKNGNIVRKWVNGKVIKQ